MRIRITSWFTARPTTPTLFQVVAPLLALASLSGCAPNSPKARPEIHVAALSASQRTSLFEELRTGTTSSSGADANDAPRAKTALCPELDLPAHYKSGAIEVPENWQDPNGRKIKVFYYYSEKAETETPIVFFNGGPASNSHGSFESFRVSRTMKQLPFIFVDQRGTGCSTKFPDAPNDDHSRLAHYGSRAIVADAEAIRKTVFQGRKWRVFGQSYGGLITHRYVMTAPEGVAAAFGHGYAIMENPKTWVANRVLSQERVWKDFIKAHPEDDETLIKARQRISADACFSNGESRVCGPEVLDSLVLMLGFQSSWPRLHLFLSNLGKADDAKFNSIVQSIAQNYALGLYASQAIAGDAITRLEIAPGMSDSEACRGAIEILQSKGKTPLEFTLNECRLLMAIERDNPSRTTSAPPFRPDPLRLSELKTALETNPQMKFYLYAGRKDVFSPVEIYTDEIATVGHLMSYREFPWSGHEGFATEPEVLSDLLAHP